MGAETERERPLEPHRLRLLGPEALVVAGQSAGRLVAQLPLLSGVAEAGPPPARVQESQQLWERGRLAGMEALEHLVDQDSEPLSDRRLLGDAEDPRELVAQGTDPVGLDVGGRQHQAVAPARQEGLERGLVSGGDRLGAPALAALG